MRIIYEADAIYFKTEDAIKVFGDQEDYDQYYGEDGYEPFETGVVYCYDNECGGFFALDKRISQYQEKLKHLTKYAEEMNKYVNAST